MAKRILTPTATAWSIRVGAVLFIGGYALLQYVPSVKPDAVPDELRIRPEMRGEVEVRPRVGIAPYAIPGRLMFWTGLGFLVIGIASWVSQPPRRKPNEEPDEEKLDSVRVESPTESEELETKDCPYCRAPIYDDSERCPRCERYISREDARSLPPAWIIVAVLICLAAVLYELAH